MADTYRKHAGRLHDWHFQPRCPDWPEADYIEQTDRPPEEALCAQCLELEFTEHSYPENQR